MQMCRNLPKLTLGFRPLSVGKSAQYFLANKIRGVTFITSN